MSQQIPPEFQQAVNEYLQLSAALAKWQEIVKSLTDRKKALSKDIKEQMVKAKVAQVGPFDRGYMAELQGTPKQPELTEIYIMSVVEKFNNVAKSNINPSVFAQFFKAQLALDTEHDLKFVARQTPEQKKRHSLLMAQQTMDAISSGNQPPRFNPIVVLSRFTGVNVEVLQILEKSALDYISEKRQRANKEKRSGMMAPQEEKTAAVTPSHGRRGNHH